MAKETCKNCGDSTNFSNAALERLKLGWCTSCFKNYQPGKPKSGLLVSCTRCGRDTRAESGYCNNCVGRGNPFSSREQIGRSSRSSQVLGGVPTTNTDEDDADDPRDYLNDLH